MKYFYKIVLISTVFLVISCSKEKKETPVLEVEPVIEVVEPVVEEVFVEEINPLVFSVQIGAFQNSNVTIEDSNLDINSVEEDGLTKYRLGQFSAYQEANDLKEKIRSSYPGAFIVATNNDVRISVSEALMLSNKD